MTGIFIVPTGIGAEIGGHAGDANAAAKLIASVSDTLIVHPNVVNASDINEMTENMLYVEGSIIDRFLEGQIGLDTVSSNRILVAINTLKPELINAVSAARATVGCDANIIELRTPLRLIATMNERGAGGEVYGCEELLDQIGTIDFDALAVITPIEVARDIAMDYLKAGAGVNPWGAVEAKASRMIADAINKPVAHAPMETGIMKNFNEVVEPRRAAELVSMCYMHCVMKGLHKSPQLGDEITVDDIDVLVTPYGCVGRPHQACLERDIPVIAVRENRTVLNDPIPDKFIVVENYLEAAGVICCLKQGITTESVRRPIDDTHIIKDVGLDEVYETRWDCSTVPA